ncbi:P-loop containing nucleoside triphosphate hydrolase protein [Fimicolochytrium jonesii]|uniref:P-loop containing nucleoside triphosphate hydrolase protein n=1 Tax=Fimicolochytrium jonesii TaxID=1396493 RepID=UPI0022FF0621|nr:P-loop containing nucleoside triphosphate hydrolase protein [Fimicolochytrium jonesii]KAI8826837.1 P-loop containing nucleoside triphosphate hydrolase protein [Fimicolochytrium jonesii]
MMTTYQPHLASTESIRKQRKKLVVVGDGAAGKTSLLVVQSGEPFPEEYVPTIFENYISRVQVKDKTYELSLWDTAGQEDYDRLRPLSYPDTDVILLAFSVIAPGSYNNIREKWNPETQHFLPHVPRILVGCKTDLRHDAGILEGLAKIGQKPVTTEEGHKLAQELSTSTHMKVRYFETSAKTGDGVGDVFVCAAKMVNRGKGGRGACCIM